MTNEQKALRLEHLATICIGPDAALLRECAALLRERGAVQWVEWGDGFAALYKHRLLTIEQTEKPAFLWEASAHDYVFGHGWSAFAPTVEAAQAAAVAWVDGQEGK